MNDDELLDLLRSAVRPEASNEPSPDAIMFLHRAIDAADAPRARRRFKRVAGSCLIGVGVLAGGGGAFAANGAVLPEPIRAVAHAIGLPVDSPAVAEARAARRALRLGLQRHDSTVIAAASARLRAAMNDLSLGERADLADVTQLFEQATESTVARPSGESDGSGAGTSTTTDLGSATTVEENTTSTDQVSTSTTDTDTSTSASQDSTITPSSTETP